MSTAEHSRHNSINRDLKLLEVLRRLRRERAEAEVSIAREEEITQRQARHSASFAREAAAKLLHEWNAGISSSTYNERLQRNSALSQSIFEFKQLKESLQRREFAEFAASRRESIESNNVLTKVAIAKTAAIAHEKIIEWRK